MEPVFRFALVRPPVKESKSRFAIDLSQGTRLQVDLTAATRQADSKRALKNAYKAFLAKFVVILLTQCPAMGAAD